MRNAAWIHTTLTLAMLATHPLLVAAARGDMVAFEENFDSDAGFAKSSPFFSNGVFDFFGITGIDDFDGGSPPILLGGTPSLGGNFLVGEDLDATGAGGTLPHALTWTGINIAGLTSLEFSGDFAANTGVFDTALTAADFIQVEVQIDGNGFQEILAFEPSDEDGNGLNEDLQRLGGTETLDLNAQNFAASIAGTGSTLDLRLTLQSNSGGEAIALDNLKIVGTAVPEASQVWGLSFVAVVAGTAAVRRRRSCPRPRRNSGSREGDGAIEPGCQN